MTETRKAVVTGINGMDGSHLAELLVNKGYEVHGIHRRQSIPRLDNIQHLIDKDAVTLHPADLADLGSIQAVLMGVKPDEVYNLAAQSFVGVSFTEPEHTLDITALGAIRVMDAVRKSAPRARVYQASSSEMYGNAITDDRLQAADERTRFAPVSPYGIAKLAAHHYAAMCRSAYGLHVSCGILFNHEGPRRGRQFLTRKVSLGLSRVALGLQSQLRLGNVSAVRDWGYAPDYVDACWRMLQQDESNDYVVATGEPHTVWDFVEAAWAYLRSKGLLDGDDPHSNVVSIPEERRPTDIGWLVGDASKAYLELEWRPRVRFDRLVTLMVDHDLRLAKEEVKRAEEDRVETSETNPKA